MRESFTYCACESFIRMNTRSCICNIFAKAILIFALGIGRDSNPALLQRYAVIVIIVAFWSSLKKKQFKETRDATSLINQ